MIGSRQKLHGSQSFRTFDAAPSSGDEGCRNPGESLLRLGRLIRFLCGAGPIRLKLLGNLPLANTFVPLTFVWAMNIALYRSRLRGAL